MVLTKDELISLLQQEIRILLHLAGKVDRAKLDYRPTSTQRSTIELIQYLAVMGPTQLAVIKAGVFDRPTLTGAWGPATERARGLDFEQAVAAIAQLSEEYARELGGWEDADFRRMSDVFGKHVSRGALVVNLVAGGHAAYRTQLFCYLKACGREELGTVNLWAGVDGM
jgi:hypothetical protein